MRGEGWRADEGDPPNILPLVALGDLNVLSPRFQLHLLNLQSGYSTPMGSVLIYMYMYMCFHTTIE